MSSMPDTSHLPDTVVRRLLEHTDRGLSTKPDDDTPMRTPDEVEGDDVTDEPVDSMDTEGTTPLRPAPRILGYVLYAPGQEGLYLGKTIAWR